MSTAESVNGSSHPTAESSDRRAEILLRLFRGRADYVAVPNGAGFKPYKLQAPIHPELLAQRHLAGVQCLGFYVMTEDETVWCSCVDIDGNPSKSNPDLQWREKAEAVTLFLLNIGLKPVVEVSQSGAGVHIWLFFDPSVEGWLIRAFWRVVGAKTDIAFKEIFPKQDCLSGKGLGNLVRYPLWNQSRFVDVEDWSEVAVESLETVERVTAAQLKMLAFQLGVSELKPCDPPPANASAAGASAAAAEPTLSPRVQSLIGRAGKLLARRWAGDTAGMKDGSRSALALAIATELVRQYVPTDEIAQAVRFWCRERTYEKGERADWVAGLIAKAYDFVLARVEERSSADADGVTDQAEPLFPAPVVASALKVRAAAEPIWDGHLFTSAITLLVALWKVGKTTLLSLLLQRLMPDSSFCGRALRPGKVLVVTEESEELWIERRDRLGIGDHVSFLCRPLFGTPAHADWVTFIQYLVELVQAGGFKLLVLDTVATFWPVVDENDAAQVLAALKPLRLISEAGCAVLLVHHPRKCGGGEFVAAHRLARRQPRLPPGSGRAGLLPRHDLRGRRPGPGPTRPRPASL
jgi:hypothetical protein